MRIGIDAWGLSGDLAHTGTGVYASQLISHLPTVTPDASIVAYGARDEGRPAWLPDTVAWRPVTSVVGGRWQALFTRTLMLRRAAAADKIDIFHAPGVHTRASLPPVASVGCRLVATVHDLIPIRYYGKQFPMRSRTFYAWNLHRALRADAIVTVSEASREDIIAYAPSAESKCTAISNGVAFAPRDDPGALARLGVQRPFILYAGSYEPRKNLGTALSAFARLVDAGLPHRLVAIVDAKSGHAPAMASHMTSLGLGDRVSLLSGLPEPDLRALYTSAEVLCFPSLAEGFGFPPLQAAACGTPVVASGLDSVRETLGDNAVFANPDDPEDLAHALRLVLDDPALRARLTSGAERRAQAYTWERSARMHMTVYDAVMAVRPATDSRARPRAAD